MQTIAGLPGTYDRYSAFTFVELERRTATGVGTYSSTFYYLCNAPQNITYGGAVAADRPAVGAVFTARNFANPTIVTDGQLGNVTSVKFDDFDDVLKTLALTYDMLDWQVRIWEGGVDTNFTITWMKLKIKGRTEDQSWDVLEGDDFTLDVGTNGAVVDTAGPREIYAPTCRFVREFKGARCAAVTASTTCDGQLATCTSFGNQRRFGGFPDSPAPGSVIGVWGGTVVNGATNFTGGPEFYR